jgi:N-methylhydantoinase A/oxoprolinase/acetone carboxylase beta subunit
MHGKQQRQPHTRSGTVSTFDVSLSRDATTMLGAGAVSVACAVSVATLALDIGEARGITLTFDMGGTTNS